METQKDIATMLENIKRLKELLTAEKNCYIKNDLTAIQNNNELKLAIIHELNNSSHAMSKKQLNITDPEIKNAILEEIKICDNQIKVNSHLIQVSLNNVKNIINKLINLCFRNNTTYNRQGKL